MPLVQTRGAASAQGFGEFAQAAVAANYIEEVFSTYLYTGNDSTQTITNNIDLSTKGGMVFVKGRDIATGGAMIDTVRGVNKNIVTDQNYAQDSDPSVSAFNITGFSINSAYSFINDTGNKYVSWTFRKQPKFFDVLTYTGTGSAQTIAHSLGSVPGSIFVKRTNTTSNWRVYHRSLTSAAYMVELNTSAGEAVQNGAWNSTAPTSSVFTVGSASEVNASGSTYVAYVFAHDAGGFGLTGTDNVISCGSYIGNGLAAGPSINLGYEPQFVIIKHSSGSNDWELYDNMRGVATGGNDALLRPNTSGAEEGTSDILSFTATGFQLTDTFSNTNGSGETYIYIAIRRGPMKVPTVGTSVFGLSARTGTGANATVTGGQTDDAVIVKNRGSAIASLFSSRLTGTGYLVTSSTAAEVAAGTTILQANPWDVMDGVKVGTTSTITNASANTYINYLFKRAPSFFDDVCYTGTGVARTLTHNLAAVPDMMIVKARNVGGFSAATYAWQVYHQSTAAGMGPSKYISLNTTAGEATGSDRWNNTAPTSSVFTVGNAPEVNESSSVNYVAYLFSTCAGVSKVGSYTGTGTTLQINCGFTAGARFVLIKRTDSTGDWYVWDSARGIIAGNDPYLLLNSTAAEVTSTDYIDTYSAGFEISSTAPAAINASAGTFVFLAIA